MHQFCVMFLEIFLGRSKVPSQTEPPTLPLPISKFWIRHCQAGSRDKIKVAVRELRTHATYMTEDNHKFSAVQSDYTLEKIPSTTKRQAPISLPL